MKEAYFNNLKTVLNKNIDFVEKISAISDNNLSGVSLFYWKWRLEMQILNKWELSSSVSMA